mgnify:CR=1 FL=1
MKRAKDLIYLAAEAGADAAKFQHFSAKTIVSDYGFKSIKGVLPYLIGVLICYIVSFVSFNAAQTMSVLGSINNADTVKNLFLGFGYIFFVFGARNRPF